MKNLLTRERTRTVMICDDRPEIRDAIADMMSQLPAFRVVGYARDARSCLDGLAAWLPDILILDVNMPGGGPEVARAAKGISSNLHIVVFSGQCGEGVRQEMLTAGADQFVLKTGRLSPLIRALHRAHAGADRRL